MKSIEDVIRNYTNEAKTDYVGLWQITGHFKDRAGIQSDAEIKEKSLQVVRGLINNGVYPGFMAEGHHFNFLQGNNTEELIAQIAASWPTVGTPDLSGNFCWFATRSHFDTEGNHL